MGPSLSRRHVRTSPLLDEIDIFVLVSAPCRLDILLLCVDSKDRLWCALLMFFFPLLHFGYDDYLVLATTTGFY